LSDAAAASFGPSFFDKPGEMEVIGMDGSCVVQK
jgi:hypothetical protein